MLFINTQAKSIYKVENILFFADGEPIKLPESLESLPKSDHFPTQRHRWNTNEVINYFFLSTTLY